MQFSFRSPRLYRNAAIGCAAAALTGTALAAAAHPAAAAATFAAVEGAVSCATTGTTACESYTNTSSGIAIAGTSAKGTAMRASSTSNYGLKSTSSTADAIYGQVTSSSATTSAGVYGTSPTGFGVYGVATDDFGTGVYGLSNSYIGVLAGTKSGTGTGLYASSVSGKGAAVYSSSGDALFAEAITSGIGIYATATSGYGVESSTSGGISVVGLNSNGNAADFEGTYIGVIGRAPTNGAPFVATDSSGNNVFQVTGTGDINYAGTIQPYVRTKGGSTMSTFMPKTSTPTMEDTGTAQLTGGAASVRLDAAFAATIDPATPYRVFVTPNGDTHGIYVASKTPAGFVVRENQGGRSTTSFDYRIVAASIGQTGRRMAPIDPKVGLARATPPHLVKPHDVYLGSLPVVK